MGELLSADPLPPMDWGYLTPAEGLSNQTSQRTSNALLQARPIHCCTEEHRIQMQQINLNKSTEHSPLICPRNNSLSRAWATGKSSKASDVVNNVYIQNLDVIFHPLSSEKMACYFLLNQGQSIHLHAQPQLSLLISTQGVIVINRRGLCFQSRLEAK